MRHRSLFLGLAFALALPGMAMSLSLKDRTYVLSVTADGTTANGDSTRPALSANGLLVAFDSTAANLAPDANGEVRDVFARDLVSNQVRLVSRPPDGQPADGASSHAQVAGQMVVFQSDATNLVADGNGVRDVYARDIYASDGNAPAVRVSEALGGGDANGASSDADISADGRHVAFVSSASNLVPGDTNKVADVFVRDLRKGTTRRVSAVGRSQANGPSAAPAISGNGRFVAFASTATNLVKRDRNRTQDILVKDLRRGGIERISVSSSGRQQNRSVIKPFTQVSDISANGRFVVFDSDATNLVEGDRNRDTDVFVRDRRLDVTNRISVDKFGFEADNDSFNPSISSTGRFIAFQSFATRLATGDGPKEDVFLYDAHRFAPTVVTLGSRGQRRGRELTRQLLQRPAVSTDGQLVAFTSTASNLVKDDVNRAEDVFLRVTAPPRVRIVQGPRGTTRKSRPLLVLSADDRRAREFICNIDAVRIRCGKRTRLPPLPPGPHVLRVRAGGAGMLYQDKPVVRKFRVVP